jgi:membrane-associated PAP2 superfamily phosphatase
MTGSEPSPEHYEPHVPGGALALDRASLKSTETNADGTSLATWSARPLSLALSPETGARGQSRKQLSALPTGYRFQLAPVVHAAVAPPVDVAPTREASWSGTMAYQARVWRRQWGYRLRTPWAYKTDWPLVAPLALIAVLTLVCRWAELDLAISQWFYDPAAREWPWLLSLPCTAFYRLGIFPPFLLALSGCFLLFGGHLFEPTGTLRRAGLFLVLLMIIGPGLIVNVGFKEFWGRPRPNQIAQFGGKFRHAEVGLPGGLPHGNSSFPSGHASLAFYMMAPGFLVGKRRPQLAAGLLVGGTIFGLCMSASRVIQGAHFASDVVWGGAIVYFTGVALSRIILKPRLLRPLCEPAFSDRR